MAKRKGGNEGTTRRPRPTMPGIKEMFQHAVKAAKDGRSMQEAANDFGTSGATYRNHLLVACQELGEAPPRLANRRGGGGSRGYIKVGAHKKTGRMRMVISDSYLRRAGFKAGVRLTVEIEDNSITLSPAAS